MLSLAGCGAGSNDGGGSGFSIEATSACLEGRGYSVEPNYSELELLDEDVLGPVPVMYVSDPGQVDIWFLASPADAEREAEAHASYRGRLRAEGNALLHPAGGTSAEHMESLVDCLR